MKGSKIILFVVVMVLCGMYSNNVNACSRVMYKGKDSIYMTARTFDWPGKIPTTLWIIPRGFSANGYAGPNSIEWKSKYGSVIAGAFGGATDGMNEKGLMVNMLWCRGAQFADPKLTDKPLMMVGMWTHYMLDNFATVNEAVEGMENRNFEIVGMVLPGFDFTLDVHVSISDASGDNAIFEYVGGKMIVYHDKDYKVMTNEPTYDKQLALAEYWKGVGEFSAIPGTFKPEERFVQALYYSNLAGPVDDDATAAAIAMSIARKVSVPMGIRTEERPNMSTTTWRVVADHKNLIYYYEDAETFNSTMWIDLKKVDFSSEKGSQKLDMTKSGIGDVSDKLIKANYVIEIPQ